MIPINTSETNDFINNKYNIKKDYFNLQTLSYFFFIIILIITLFIISHLKFDINRNEKGKLNRINKSAEFNKIKGANNNCYLIMDNPNIRIIHFIITRFIIEFPNINKFKDKIYGKEYITNGIRVMKKYLFPSLENQSCKNFIWILLLGNKANMAYIKSLIDFNNSFEMHILYQKDIKTFMKNKTIGFDILITTRIDYDDAIYYDAVNDVRKVININKPILLYGYNRGVYFYEEDRKYYEFYQTFKNEGVMSIFASLILVLNKVNGIYNIYEIGDHTKIRKEILKSYKKYGIKILNYDPAIFDSGDQKFIYVRQKYSGTFNYSKKIPKNFKAINFDLNKFYGK